jgi:hypothetical protein
MLPKFSLGPATLWV